MKDVGAGPLVIEAFVKYRNSGGICFGSNYRELIEIEFIYCFVAHRNINPYSMFC
jgi:hypothetical protein